MHRARGSLIFGLALGLGCFAKESIADNPSETDGDTAGDDVVGDDGVGDDDGDGTDGATGGVPGPMVVDGVVDCSTLPANGPIVAGGEVTALGLPEYHCNPRQAPADPANTEYSCCSVDPAAEGGELPAYMGKNIDGSTPYFSGQNNDLGVWGMCVRTADIPTGSGLLEPAAANCPVPCNPTWDESGIVAVCGSGRVCCQTHELQPEDCVVDPDTGEWRPVTGEDIGRKYDDDTVVTDWSPGAHATHQDPGGSGCAVFAGGSSGPVFTECVAELAVADQRGVCMALGPGEVCPAAQPSYIDACEAL